ncbi:hypothetical protein, partial [Saccharomonospora iraqiensis]|uniref:hypothetical protein n=1 Tax=Saccharomonospora iraqiensis TaxID=52698 RepID=UPI00047C4262
MRRRLPRALAAPVTVAVLVLSAAPAAGQTVPTTPEPEPVEEGQPPFSDPPTPEGRAIGKAGTALGMLRLAPEAVPAEASMPGVEESLPDQSALEGGFGLSRAEANSESYLTYERAIAEASPFGLAVGGHAPTVPGAVSQTALPDNEDPVSTGFEAPDNPLVGISGLNGSAHARWSPTTGPCVGTIADSSTSAAHLSLVDAIPTMPDTHRLSDADDGGDTGALGGDDGALGDGALGDGALGGDGAPGEDGVPGEDSASGEDDGQDDGDRARAALSELPGPLAHLGGLLSGGGDDTDGTGSLISAPQTLSTRSVVRLTDIPGSDRKAVESISTMRAARLEILKGTPLGLTVRVADQPTLRVVSTGDPDTSTVEYTAPVLAFERDGETLFELDAANPTRDIPLGIPLPGLTDVPGFEQVRDAPVLGGVAELVGGGLKELTDRASEHVLDLGVLRVSVAGLDERAGRVTEPFTGHHVSAAARMLDLRVLPTDGLREALPPEQAERLPSSLAQVSLGEQKATAFAPEGGVECGPPAAPPADV